MAEYLIQDTTLDAIADAINAKTGGSSAMTPAEMVSEIQDMPSGGGDPNVIVYEFTPVSDIAPGQTVTFNVGAVNAKIIAFTLVAKKFPAQNPPSGQYYYLNGCGAGVSLTSVGDAKGANINILRADGTLGSGTSGEFAFNASTGVLTLKPQYGSYTAGEKYRFVLQIGG